MQDVRFETVTWPPGHADVDLSIACMFEREMTEAHLTGGLQQLNDALGGVLTALRNEGYFRAQEMETLLVRTPPIRVVARSILIIGLGSPITFGPAILERATRVAVREAIRLGASTVAFAPSLLDEGLTNVASLQVEAAMVRGIVSALQAEYRLSELGLASSPVTRSWAFDTGPAHFDAATAGFMKAFRSFTAL